MDGPGLELILIVFAILANGFFAGSEIALVSSRISRLTQLREESVPGSAAALHLKEAPETFLATIQIAITLVGTLASAVGGATAVEALKPLLEGLPLPGTAAWAEPVALTLVILAITYVSLVLGELAPKALALRNPEQIACLVARPILWLSRVSSGLVRALTRSTEVVLRFLGQRPSAESPFVSEEEVKYLVREGRVRGVFEKIEEELVHNVFEFADTTVREVLVPRSKIRSLDIRTPPSQLVQRAAEIGHSRIPVYRESIENMAGVLFIKDLLQALAEGRTLSLSELLRPALFVPESVRISRLLAEFQRSHRNLAIVVDEHGSVAGLVTLEDILEEIVGEIRDEREPMTPLAARSPEGALIVEGAIAIRDLRDQTGITIPESDDYVTVAGLIMHVLQSVPAAGASVVTGGHRWTVVEMEGPRIAKVKVEPAAG